jgi:hypothetical protein
MKKGKKNKAENVQEEGAKRRMIESKRIKVLYSSGEEIKGERMRTWEGGGGERWILTGKGI